MNHRTPLEAIFDRAVNEFRLPGLQAGILFPNRKPLLASSGKVDFGRRKSRITNPNLFRMGSATKMFAGFGGECFPFYFPEKDVSIVVFYNWSKKDNPAGKAVLRRIVAQVTGGLE